MRLDEAQVARAAADELLIRLGSVAKALDLSTPGGFDRAVEALAARLRAATTGAEREAVRVAINSLDVDWTRTTAAQRRAVVDAAMARAGRALAVVPARIQADLGESAREVVARTRSWARRSERLAIGVASNAVDARMIRFAQRSQALFVTDAQGRRLDALGAQVRTVVAQRLAAGRDRTDIATELAQLATHQLAGRTPAYWDVVAAAFIGQARSFAQVSAYAEAGIERFRVQAVLDEVTSAQCRFLHGKVFSVQQAIAQFERLERLREPTAIKQAAPWVRRRAGALWIDGQDGERRLADITRDAVGTLDDPGEFRARVDDEELGGLGPPPYHGRCRSTALPA